MRPIQRLQLGEEVAEVLGVQSLSPTDALIGIRRQAQLSFGENSVNHPVEPCSQFGWVGGLACHDQRVIDVVGAEQVGGERPEPMDRGLRSSMTLARPVAQPHNPGGGPLQSDGLCAEAIGKWTKRTQECAASRT